MFPWQADRVSRRRGLLLAVAALLTASALIAVVILLVGSSGALEGRILRTTALLAGYGVVALPAAMLLDEGRGRALAPAMLGLAAVGAALALAVNWMDDPPVTLGKAAGSVAVAAVAGAQVSGLVALRRTTDPRIVGALFVASTVLAATVTVVLAVMIWAEIGGDASGRVVAALIVLDLLAAGLQPILARVRPVGIEAHLRITTVAGAPQEITASGRDLASAVAGAIRAAEAAGGRVRSVEVIEAPEVVPVDPPLSAAS
ncbi:MAG: hypothetical protein ACKVZ6_02550 [Kineosporiaceae bacterium]